MVIEKLATTLIIFSLYVICITEFGITVEEWLFQCNVLYVASMMLKSFADPDLNLSSRIGNDIEHIIKAASPIYSQVYQIYKLELRITVQMLVSD
jgi:hypothetical protein